MAACYQHYVKSQGVVGVLTRIVISTVYFKVKALFLIRQKRMSTVHKTTQ